MNKNKIFNFVLIILPICIVFLATGVISVLASPPTNDDFDSATVIIGPSFNEATNTTEASFALDDPSPCGIAARSVWYQYTPTNDTNVTVSANTNWGYYATLGIYTGTRGSLVEINCGDNNGQIAINFSASAGTTYYFELMSRYEYGAPYPPPYPDGGDVTINLAENIPPPNDNFQNATAITGLPFDANVDTAYASVESGEPSPSCTAWPTERTIWYTFTPATNGYFSMNSGSSGPVIAVYQGTSINDLQQISCGEFGWGSVVTFQLEGNTTYYFQTFQRFEYYGWSINFHLDVPPPPVANFYYWPSDPSKYDSIQFSNNSYDPAGVGIQSYAWDFGDGTTSSDWNPVHHYTRDGDYTVNLNLITYDGRTASTSQVISVRTHDIGITKFIVPTAARIGQTRQLGVYIKNLLYPEKVEVQLFKSTVNGYELVGTLRQDVPVRPGNRTTLFAFSYTFTKDDAALGKVTFRSIAMIVNARDAFPADNEIIAFPTRVTR